MLCQIALFHVKCDMFAHVRVAEVILVSQVRRHENLSVAGSEAYRGASARSWRASTIGFILKY